MNNFTKSLLFVGGILILLWILDFFPSKSDDTIYEVNINKNPIKICGKEFYITNYSHNDEILIYDMIDSIECTCTNNC